MKTVQIESTSLDELIGRIRAILNELKAQTSDSSQQEEELRTREETAEFFRVSYQTLHNWKKDKILLPIKVGTRVYYRKTDIDNLIIKKGGNYAV